MNRHDPFDTVRQSFIDAKLGRGNRELRQELLDRAERDQDVRRKMAAKYKPGDAISKDDMAWALAVDSSNTTRMKEVVAQLGWPGKSLVGEDGAHAAWLLVQHADQDIEFQRLCLKLLAQAVANDEASAQELAYLMDRVRVHSGQPQVFGTQLHLEGDQLVTGPIENEADVDNRRAKIGMMPLAEYIALCSGNTTPKK